MTDIPVVPQPPELRRKLPVSHAVESAGTFLRRRLTPGLWLMIVLVAAYVAVGLWILPDGPLGNAKQDPAVLIVACYPIIGAVIAHRLRTGVSYPVAWRATVTRAAVLRLAAGAIGAQIFLAAFMAWKAHLPVWGHWWADPMLADFDARLHGGDVWRILVPLGTPGLVALDFVYHLWLPVLCLMIGWRAWAGDIRFFVAFALAWILLGTALALALHSAGPIFYHGVTGEPRYAELLARLDASPLLRTHETRWSLWNAYAAGNPSSISAFPSMHVAIPTLYALCCPVRWLRPVLWSFVVLLVLATVATGFHYAVDAYAAVLGALGCWWLAGKLTR